MPVGETANSEYHRHFVNLTVVSRYWYHRFGAILSHVYSMRSAGQNRRTFRSRVRSISAKRFAADNNGRKAGGVSNATDITRRRGTTRQTCDGQFPQALDAWQQLGQRQHSLCRDRSACRPTTNHTSQTSALKGTNRNEAAAAAYAHRSR